MSKSPFGIRNSISLSFLLLFLFCYVAGNLTAQVNARINYLRESGDSSKVIRVEWAPQDEDQWHVENDGRLDIIGLKAVIPSANLPKSGSNLTSYKFDNLYSCEIELLVNFSTSAPGEEIYLWDKQDRKIIAMLTGKHQKRFLTPSFNPETTVLIWNCQEKPAFQSEFSIELIYYNNIENGRALDIGFGTALACHPNAACKTDSLKKLIAESAVRIRLVMEEGIGWCTGSFVNNTRNDKTPYLLTAFHCQFDYTPHYDMWRFDFDYTSATCQNPLVEPQYFSLTGCELKASGQASDFLLLLLEDQIPLNQQVTFAGWDHDDAITPDTSYLIHHPNADIRKFSTSVQKAIIHPNQIGWSEGYITPANHHFRFKFTEGGHEPGSSGGPLFNQAGYLVGQLHGGTAGCEDINNVYIGRLSKSWNPGITAQDRLIDWLDPDQSGAIRIPSLPNKSPEDLGDIHGQILDPKGRPVKNIAVKVTGSVDDTLITGADGRFLLTGISRNGQYTFTPRKTDNPINGINALDLLLIQKHLLAKDTFDFAWEYIAADATNNLSVNVADILLVLKVLLGKLQSFPSSPSWRFDPAEIMIDSIPPGGPLEVQMMGIKIGDINGTADPQQ